MACPQYTIRIFNVTETANIVYSLTIFTLLLFWLESRKSELRILNDVIFHVLAYFSILSHLISISEKFNLFQRIHYKLGSVDPKGMKSPGVRYM